MEGDCQLGKLATTQLVQYMIHQSISTPGEELLPSMVPTCLKIICRTSNSQSRFAISALHPSTFGLFLTSSLDVTKQFFLLDWSKFGGSLRWIWRSASHQSLNPEIHGGSSILVEANCIEHANLQMSRPEMRVKDNRTWWSGPVPIASNTWQRRRIIPNSEDEIVSYVHKGSSYLVDAYELWSLLTWMLAIESLNLSLRLKIDYILMYFPLNYTSVFSSGSSEDLQRIKGRSTRNRVGPTMHFNSSTCRGVPVVSWTTPSLPKKITGWYHT